jgi:hypothetical protein
MVPSFREDFSGTRSYLSNHGRNFHATPQYPGCKAMSIGQFSQALQAERREPLTNSRCHYSDTYYGIQIIWQTVVSLSVGRSDEGDHKEKDRRGEEEECHRQPDWEERAAGSGDELGRPLRGGREAVPLNGLTISGCFHLNQNRPMTTKRLMICHEKDHA